MRTLSQEARKLPWEQRKPTVEALSRLAGDPEPFVRWRLAAALGELGHPAGIEALEKLANDAHANTRLRVALAAAALDAQEALPLLERLAGDPYKIGDHAVVRAFAAVGLGRLGLPGAVEALARLGDDEDGVVRWHAVVALGDVGDQRAGPLLMRRLNDPVPFVRGHAAIALAQVGDAKYLDELERAAAQEKHEKMKTVIASAARLLKERPK